MGEEMMPKAEVPEPEGPLFSATTQELCDELRRRFPVGSIFLMRPGRKNDEVNFFSPWWGNPYTVLGIVVEEQRMIHEYLQQGYPGAGEMDYNDQKDQGDKDGE